MAERLQKLMSQAGIASRRAAEDMIRQGRVKLNGKPAQLGDKADLAHDTVTVDGKPLGAPEFVYYLLHKPRGVVSSNRRQRGDKRRLVVELIPHQGHIYSVGRLDADSEGLILLTNDGELADKLMHPRYEHSKTYHVLVEGQPAPHVLEQWRSGVDLNGRQTAPAKVRVLSEKPDATWLQVVLHEGRKRQIRRVAALLGHPVRRLVREKLEFLELGHLKPGEWRELTPKEVRRLKQES